MQIQEQSMLWLPLLMPLIMLNIKYRKRWGGNRHRRNRTQQFLQGMAMGFERMVINSLIICKIQDITEKIPPPPDTQTPSYRSLIILKAYWLLFNVFSVKKYILKRNIDKVCSVKRYGKIMFSASQKLKSTWDLMLLCVNSVIPAISLNHSELQSIDFAFYYLQSHCHGLV